ncbi:MAG: DUF6602 domain-containing protein [Dyadobacter sp.]|uniref:DUF6602 domain-containing protein n=1 Tax=Dyadobacter sp. TaxID=1914288 RepID=UPI003266AA52
MLREVIDVQEVQMQSELARLRATFRHSGIKGTGTEKAFLEFIRQYISLSHGVGQGEIIDSYGNRSGQADVVIINQDHPFTFSSNAAGLFFIEGVTAAGEIKSKLTSGELTKALKSAVKFKRLQMNDPLGKTVTAKPSDAQRFGRHPPYFLFCFESQLSLDRIHQNILAFCKKNQIQEPHTIDAVFVINKGFLVDLGDGTGAYKAKNSQSGKDLESWTKVTKNTVLFDCLAWLSITMPRSERPIPILTQYLPLLSNPSL